MAKFETLNLDGIVAAPGVWSENIGKQNGIGVYFDDLLFAYRPSWIDLNAQRPTIKQRSEFWNKRIVHVNGEHTYKVISRQ